MSKCLCLAILRDLPLSTYIYICLYLSIPVPVSVFMLLSLSQVTHLSIPACVLTYSSIYLYCLYLSIHLYQTIPSSASLYLLILT